MLHKNLLGDCDIIVFVRLSVRPVNRKACAGSYGIVDSGIIKGFTDPLLLDNGKPCLVGRFQQAQAKVLKIRDRSQKKHGTKPNLGQLFQIHGRSRIFGVTHEHFIGNVGDDGGADVWVGPVEIFPHSGGIGSSSAQRIGLAGFGVENRGTGRIGQISGDILYFAVRHFYTVQPVRVAAEIVGFIQFAEDIRISFIQHAALVVGRNPTHQFSGYNMGVFMGEDIHILIGIAAIQRANANTTD